MDFLTHIKDILNEYYEPFINSLNDEAYSGLYLNDNKFIELSDKSIFTDLERHHIIENNFIFKKSINQLGKHPFFDLGLYYIQEPSAMLVSYLLNPKPNERIIDLCAAPGGKSCYTALNCNFLLSNDYSNSRANILSENIERMGIENTIVTSNDVKYLSDNLCGQFDKVILDAPCSGEGMFRKSEEVYKDWSLEKVESLSSLQKELILQAYKLLKKDGIMAYSTCTYEIKENEEVINYLLENTNATLINIFECPNFIRGFGIKEAIRLIPPFNKGEGHFICLIKCNDEHKTNKLSLKLNFITNKDYNIYRQFEKEYLNIKFDKNRIVNNNSHLHYLPENYIMCSGLNIKRLGLDLGEIKKDRFVPSHALIRYLDKNQFKNTIELNDNEIISYLKGNTIDVNSSKNGFYMVTYKNIPAGLGKISNGQLKNHYPKGLRRN